MTRIRGIGLSVAWSVAFLSTAQVQAGGPNHLMRWFGWGWSDGYHSYQTDRVYFFDEYHGVPYSIERNAVPTQIVPAQPAQSVTRDVKSRPVQAPADVDSPSDGLVSVLRKPQGTADASRTRQPQSRLPNRPSTTPR